MRRVNAVVLGGATGAVAMSAMRAKMVTRKPLHQVAPRCPPSFAQDTAPLAARRSPAGQALEPFSPARSE